MYPIGNRTRRLAGSGHSGATPEIGEAAGQGGARVLIMTSPPEYPDDDDDEDFYASLEAIDRDLERLGDLSGPYVTDTSDDLTAAVARIPDTSLRREAEELLERLRPLADSHLVDGITPPRPGGLQPALRSSHDARRHRHRSSQ
jgi:hypothetical protein